MLCLLTSMNLKDNPHDYVKIEVEVHAPAESGDCIYMSGSIRELGSFEAKGIKLIKIEPGRYKGSFYTKHHGMMEYKYNLGSWNNVEVSARGEDLVGNRSVMLTGKSLAIRDTVEHWEGIQKSTITGDFQIFFDFRSKFLNKRRNIYVWLPPGYANSQNEKYPMILCQDGQNLFDASMSYLGVEWEMDETATHLIQRYEIDPVIIVGIANTEERIWEYTPDGFTKGGGGVENYGRFVVEELIPFLIKRLKIDTRSGRTCTLGASVGAIASLYLYSRYPRIFNLAAAMSPTGIFGRSSLNNWVAEQSFSTKGKLWLDIGTEEGIEDGTGISSAVKEMRQLRKIFTAKGFVDGESLLYMEETGGEHNEISWQRRVPSVLKFLYGNSYGNFNIR